jgi:hypothetical protein
LELELVGVAQVVDLPPPGPPPEDGSPPPPPPEPPPPPRVRTVVTVAAGEYITQMAPNETRPFGLGEGTRVKVRFITATGLHNGHSVVVQLEPQPEGALQITLSELTDVETTQRRKHFRVGAFLQVQLDVTESAVEGLQNAYDARAMTINFSGGGFLIETRLRLAVADHVRVTLRVPKDLRNDLPEVLVCEAVVMRVTEIAFDQIRIALRSSFPRDVGRDLWVQLVMNLQFGRT